MPEFFTRPTPSVALTTNLSRLNHPDLDSTNYVPSIEITLISLYLKGLSPGDAISDLSVSWEIHLPKEVRARCSTFHMNSNLQTLGFHIGNSGTHARRTMMFYDLEHLLNASPVEHPANYFEKIVDENVLHKPTAKARRDAYQHLRQLYGLDESIPVFRIMHRLWKENTRGRNLLALLCVMARDPILRSTENAILNLEIGTLLDRHQVKESVTRSFQDKFRETTMASIVRNVASSWTQSGHLVGKSSKVRTRPESTPENATFAVLLSFLTGSRGRSLLENQWTRLLDLNIQELTKLLDEASRKDLIRLRRSGAVFEIRLDTLLTKQEIETANGSN